jgi:two-component system sensor histidine kinase KdpD
MLIASMISCTLATRVKKQARLAAQKAYAMELLITSNQKLQQGQDEQDMIQIAAEQLAALLSRPILYALAGANGELAFHAVPLSEARKLVGTMTTTERAVADWVVKNNKHAGATTSTLSQARNLYLSVRGNQEVMGVIAIPVQYYPPLDVFEKNLMISIVNECGLMLERRRLRAEKQQIEMETQRERLRANLLRAISHDLRTPLTSISGNAGILMEKGSTLDEKKKQDTHIP